MAADPKQEAINRMWNYLLAQGIGGYEFPTYDSTYMGDLYNLYEDMVLSDSTINFDSVSPKYEPFAAAGDPMAVRMGNWFIDIENGKSPDQIIAEQKALGEELNDTLKDDLNRYASEKYSRDKAAYDFNFKASGAAQLYGLPDPNKTFELPAGIVRELIKQKDGKTPQEVAARELIATRRMADEQLKAKGQSLPTTKIVDAEPGFTDDPAGFLFNKGVDALNWLNKNIKIGAGGAPISAIPKGVRPGFGVDESTKITRPTEVTIPPAERKYGGAAGARIASLERLQKLEAEGEVKLQEALAKQIMEKFGTPYEAALREAARIAASRKKGASGNWPA